MVNVFLIIVALVACFWLVISLLLAWENRRFCRVRLATPVTIRNREHRVAVFLPCKGDDGDLAQNLEAFFQQQHPNYELHLIVESKADAAWPVIQQVCARHPHIESRTVVAGKATTDGQKVHNLRVATRRVDAGVGILAFADSDIRPHPEWLQGLTITVARSKGTTANTGYRWMLPERNTLINLLVYSINSTIAGTMGSGKRMLIWGGSWAIRKNSFDRLKIRDAWKGTLSDDLVASRVIHDQSEDVRFGPRCLCRTSFDMTWQVALEFLRRQFLIGRKYAGQVFWPGYLVIGATVLAWWAFLFLALFSAPSIVNIFSIGVAVFYVAGVLKGALRQSVFRFRDPETWGTSPCGSLV